MRWILKLLHYLGLLERYWLEYDNKKIYVYGSYDEEYINDR